MFSPSGLAYSKNRVSTVKVRDITRGMILVGLAAALTLPQANKGSLNGKPRLESIESAPA
jgi:hypothetical protein